MKAESLKDYLKILGGTICIAGCFILLLVLSLGTIIGATLFSFYANSSFTLDRYMETKYPSYSYDVIDRKVLFCLNHINVTEINYDTSLFVDKSQGKTTISDGLAEYFLQPVVKEYILSNYALTDFELDMCVSVDFSSHDNPGDILEFSGRLTDKSSIVVQSKTDESSNVYPEFDFSGTAKHISDDDFEIINCAIQ